jgi:hypothetical protein
MFPKLTEIPALSRLFVYLTSSTQIRIYIVESQKLSENEKSKKTRLKNEEA